MLALLATAALAPTATVGLEGTELVYRAPPGGRDAVTIAGTGRAVEVFGRTAVTPGPGCTATRRAVRCSTAGATAIRVLAADGHDDVGAEVELPLIVDLGPGNDRFEGSTPSIQLTGGEGDDEASFAARAGAIDMGAGDDIGDAVASDLTGPLTLAGGDGDDRLFIYGSTGPGTVLSGGPGDDAFTVQSGEGPGAELACGPGADRIFATPAERLGEGCAPQLVGITANAVSRTFREGVLSAPAQGSVTIRRDLGYGQRGARTLARGTFDAPAGPLRLRLSTTASGRAALQRRKRPPVVVIVRTRSGGDRAEVEFASRLSR